MEKLSEDGRGVYELLRADLAVDLDKRFRDQGADLLKAMEKLISTNTSTLDGLLSSRVDGVRDELLMEIEQIRGEPLKGSTPPQEDPSPSRVAGNGRGGGPTDSLSFDNDYRGKAHNTYVPPPVRGARESNFSFRPSLGRESSSYDAADSFAFGARLELPRFDGANPRLWQTRCEDQFKLWCTPAHRWISLATAQFEGAAACWLESMQRRQPQAEKELSHDWTLMRSGNHGVPTTIEWLNDVLPSGSRVGIDPFLFSSDAAEELKTAISDKNHELILIRDFNLVDEIWGESRPAPPKEPTRVHAIKYAGVDVASKLSFVRSQLDENGCDTVVISMLDEVAWLLNMRGSDVPHSPVFYSYLTVEMSTATLFVDSNKVSEEVLEHLKKAGVKLKSYEAILSDVERLAEKGAKLWLDSSSVNAAIVSVFRSGCDRYMGKRGKTGRQIGKEASSDDPTTKKHGVQNMELNGLYKASPVTLAKSVKNEAEIRGMKNSHLRDAAALAEFWCWIEEEVRNNVALTEVQVAENLLEFRRKQDGFIETSFDTISGYGANGAIIHYRPTPDSCSSVGSDNLFLLDSGAQYVDGTTDITRTVHFGEPSPRQKECFTRVLQGHIALDQAVFPERTPGFVLDVLARSSLWKIGLDYRHGTGHGVGAALNVHEGPQSISYRYGNLTALQKGMIVSNEPGYYEDNSFGIRIENLLLVKEVNLANSFGGISYLGFEKLTFVPIQRKLIDLPLLSPSEINWVNEYHEQVWEKVSPFLSGNPLNWLLVNTRPL